MSHYQVVIFSVLLVILIVLSGFFSAAETGLMSINRYRLKHKAKNKKRFAIMILRLLKRPDRLLGMILIVNCFSNILASAIATLLAVHLWGSDSAIMVTMILTLVILIFAEVAPKTLAALYPEQISRVVIWPIFVLLKFFYPLVWLINTISNGLLRLFRVNTTLYSTEPLSREELRTVVFETSGRLPNQYQHMLLGILDLNKVRVNDVMVPQHKIVGIDLSLDWTEIEEIITNSQYDWLPVYRDTMEHIVGMLHLRELMRTVLDHTEMNKELLIKTVREPYFIPENTPLNRQLLNFQQSHQRVALVVDEYGAVLGLLTLTDILGEIVGKFALDEGSTNNLIRLQADGSYLVDGSVMLRDFNRMTHWSLPKRGSRTLNGLIVEYLESIPTSNLCLRIHGFPMEIMQIEENNVKLVRVFPKRVKTIT